MKLIKGEFKEMFEVKKLLDESFHPDGYNIGINVGEHAGQSIFHCHMHLIPRYKGDVPNPKGGVRGGFLLNRIIDFER